MTDLENKVATLERKIDTLHRAFRAKCELIEELLQARQPAPEPAFKVKSVATPHSDGEIEITKPESDQRQVRKDNQGSGVPGRLSPSQPAPEPEQRTVTPEQVERGRELVQRYNDVNGSYDLMDVAGDMRDWIEKAVNN